MSDMPKTFCKAPFKTAVVDTDGRLLPCCEYMTNESDLQPYKLNAENDWMFKEWWEKGLNPLRERMIKGEIDPGCRYCISKEQNAGYRSARFNTNKKISDSYQKIIKDYQDGKRLYPKQIELRLGNYCNLKCIMCGPYASNSIMAEYKKNKKTYNDFGITSNWEDPNMRENWYAYQHNEDIALDVVSKASFIHFAGGEPFINPKIFKLLEVTKPDTKISFNTNMTMISDKVLSALDKFEFVQIQASIDGVGPHNDYLRNGSRWNKIVENLKKCKNKKNIGISINYVLQHTSLYTFENVINFVNEHNFELVIGVVYYGSVDGSGHLTINSAVKDDVDNFRRFLSANDFQQKSVVQSWVDSYIFDQKLHGRFKDYVKMLDSIRGTNFAKTFNPSWA